MRTLKLMRGLVLGSGLILSAVAAAADFDGTAPFNCNTRAGYTCEPGKGCSKVKQESEANSVIAGCAGVFAPRHRTMLVIALLCAMAVSGTIFLLLELYDPFGGVMRMSSAPIQTAVDVLAQP